MKLIKIGGLRKLFQGDSHAVVQLETGYRNTNGQRTQVGIHQFLNFLEADEVIGPKFVEYLKAKRDEAKAAADAATRTNRTIAAPEVDEDDE